MPPSHENSPTLKDVAARAGVSSVAASVVLNGSKTSATVSEATRGRILAAAAALRYHPNTVARSLRRRRTGIVGLYFGHGYIDARNAFFAEIISGLQKGCDTHRKDLLIHGTFQRPFPGELYDELLGGTIDGLFVIAAPNDPLVARLAASRLPVIALADPVPTLPSVVVDDEAGARLMAQHLAARGHRRVWFRVSPRAHASVSRRLDTFTQAAHEWGMTTVVGHSTLGGMDLGPDEEALLHLAAGERPTAVACSNDFLALNLLARCFERGLRVPGDLAVAGFDGVALASTAPGHRLTTIRAPWAEAAQTAVALLAAHIEGEEIAAETVLPVAFVSGDTT